MRNDLKKDYLWNTLGVFAQNVISPLLLVVVTRVNGIADSGIFSFAFSVAIVFWAIAMWGGRSYQVSDVKHEFTHQDYIVMRLSLAVITTIGAGGFAILNGYSLHKSSLIVILALFKATESIADVIYGVLQTHDRLYLSGKSLLYKAAANFLLFAAIDIITHNIVLASAVLILVNVLVTAVYELQIAQAMEGKRLIRFTRSHFRAALRVLYRTSPVLAVSLLAVLPINIPRYFVDRYHEGQVGYYGILAMPITLIVLVVSFLLEPNMVELSRLHHKADRTAYTRTVTRLLTVGGLAGLFILAVVYFAGTPLLRLIFGVDFTKYKDALLIVTIGGVCNAAVAILMNVLVIMRKFRRQAYTLLATNVILLVTSMFVVPEYGLNGGVSLYTGAIFLQAVAFILIYRRSLRSYA